MNPFPFVAEVYVELYLSGVRIDSFLVRHFRNYTPYRIQRLVRAGQVKVDGAPVGIDYRVYRGEAVWVRLIEPPDKLHRPEDLPLDILYEDPWIVVLDKAPGQIIHPAGCLQTGTLCNALQYHFDRQTAWPGLLRPGIVHRLDRMTSGLIVVTKEHLSHRLLSIQFQKERVAKTYLAIVEGAVDEDRGRIDLPIGTSPEAGSVLMSCRPDAGDPRPAATEFEVLSRSGRQTLVRAHPQTGRNHQIRLHLAAIGHPIVGDEFYGPFGKIKLTREEYEELRRRSSGTPEPDGDSDERLPCEESELKDASRPAHGSRHALHAHRLEFEHPILGGRIAFESPLPADLQSMLATPSTRNGG